MANPSWLAMAPALGRDAEAVSPVVGTILLVAVAVVLAGVVFLFAGRVADEAPQVAPALVFHADEADNSAVVAGTGSNIPWRDVRVTGCDYSVLDGAGVALDLLLDPDAEVQGGQRLVGCQAGETLTIVHVPSNSLLYQHRFS